MKAPALMFDLWVRGFLDDDVLAVALCDAWESAEWPLQYLSPDSWREFWELVGYVENGRRTRRPDRPLTLYRGGDPRGWSWTNSLERAQWFADRPAPTKIIRTSIVHWSTPSCCSPASMTRRADAESTST
jgi:hypothetical protein